MTDTVDPTTVAAPPTALKASVIDPIADGRWAQLLASAPGASPFHQAAWHRLLRDSYRYDIRAYGVEDPAGRLVAGLPVARIASRLTGRRLVALPFSDLCEPLVAAGAPAAATQVLLEQVVAHRAEHGLDVELRFGCADVGVPGARFWHHVVELEPDVDAVARRFSKSQVRRGIKRAVREGVVVRRATDVHALDTFYALHLRTRRHQGMPTQPKAFIRRFARLFDEGLGWVGIAEWQGRPIAAAVFLRTGTTVLYKYGASERAHLDKRPNNALFMETIRAACAEGATALDLGRTDQDNDGLRAFKLGWGAREREVAYTRLCDAREAAPAAGSGGVPPRLRRVMTAGPPVLSRAVGEALYRHYG